MPLKDRFRRAVGRSDRSSSTSSSSINTANATPTTTTPGALTPVPTSSGAPPPQLTLTKTSSKLGLSKTLTWGSSRKKEKSRESREKRLEDWEKHDEKEWVQPKSTRPGKKSKAHQDLLRAFEWKLKDGRKSIDGRRSGSFMSGISPGTSRMGSVDDGHALGRVWSAGRKRSSVAGPLSREVSRDEESGVVHPVGTVAEE